ncbi:venom allergen 3-like [Orussus abietinus]|uniref:venom allergen 3-like n=1 Tax=Orussus abietinus TaxID=222816 RepID=UPI000625D3D3|nr:venom allergen 3-like [Orussus abietinus]
MARPMLAFLFSVLALLRFSYGFSDFCHVSRCTTAKQTVCLYPDPQPSKACNQVYNAYLTRNEQIALVKKHNYYRRFVAAGKEKRGQPGPQPPASNMQDLSWDAELAYVAQRWANQCTFQHDKCRSVDRFVVGQNLAQRATTGIDNGPIENLVTSWYNEVKDFNASQVPKLSNFNAATGHYTQLVWAKSKYIGCGVIRFKPENGWNTTTLVCNYGPAGNYINQEIYKIRDGCSSRLY